MIAELLSRLRAGDRNALARLVSLAARGESLPELQLALLPSPSRRGVGGEGLPTTARVIAFTGSGGVGKSSLIGKLIPIIRAAGKRVAVLACDPQSPLSGGALLGDRFRMGSSTDDGLFIRSLAAISGRGAIADHVDVIIRLCEAFGFDVVLIETVGSGQGDVAVRNLADAVVLLLQPEAGDDVQWEKAGILECADVVVIHKADLPSAEQTAAQVRMALDLSPSCQVPVLRVSTKANQGHAELWHALEALPLRRQQASAARLLLQVALDDMQQRFDHADASELARIAAAWQRGEMPTTDAIRELRRLLLG